MTAPEAGRTTDIGLPADLSIGRVVRAGIRDHFHAWGLSDDVTYRAMVVASELASNALLHAAPPYRLRLTTDDDAVRVTVGDSSALTPSLRYYDVLALTGRGLQLVASGSSSWGVSGRGSGKEVWADVPFVEDGESSPAMETSGLAPAPSEGDSGHTVVRFLAVPVDAYMRLQEWNDAVVRECELIAALQPTPPPHLPARLLELAARLTERFAAEREGFRDVMAQARTDGTTVVDLEQGWPASPGAAVAAANDFSNMMDELDSFCRTDMLLSEPPEPVVVRLRRWFVAEMQAQLLEQATPVPFGATGDRGTV